VVPFSIFSSVVMSSLRMVSVETQPERMRRSYVVCKLPPTQHAWPA
jgi:hypothetical protein